MSSSTQVIVVDEARSDVTSSVTGVKFISRHHSVSTSFTRLCRVVRSHSFQAGDKLTKRRPCCVCSCSPVRRLRITRRVGRLTGHLRAVAPGSSNSCTPRILALSLCSVTLRVLRGHDVLSHVFGERRGHRGGISSSIRASGFLELLSGVLKTSTGRLPSAVHSRCRRTGDRNKTSVIFVAKVNGICPCVHTRALLGTLRKHVSSHPLMLFCPNAFAEDTASKSIVSLFGYLPKSGCCHTRGLHRVDIQLRT